MGLSSVSSQMNYIETQIEDSKRVFRESTYFYPEDLYLLQDVTQETASIF